MGVSTYQGTGLHNLPACAPEAEKLAAALSNPSAAAVPAAQVKYVPDHKATSTLILEEIAALAAKAMNEETLIFYFAGHGKSLPKGFFLWTRKDSGALDLGLTGEAITKAFE